MGRCWRSTSMSRGNTLQQQQLLPLMRNSLHTIPINSNSDPNIKSKAVAESNKILSQTLVYQQIGVLSILPYCYLIDSIHFGHFLVIILFRVENHIRYFNIFFNLDNKRER